MVREARTLQAKCHTQPQSAFSPFLQRPQFLEQEEIRAREASEPRDQELERLKERLIQDQLERDEMRQSMKCMMEENRKLKQKLEAQEKQKEAGPKFSTLNTPEVNVPAQQL